MKFAQSTEKWEIFEMELTSSRTFAKPFQEVQLQAYFQIGQIRKQAEGFYDGGAS